MPHDSQKPAVTTKRPDQRAKLALVIGSGGLRPFAIVPLLEFLDRHGAAPDLLVGCSGGSIIAALRARGMDGPAIRDFAARTADPKLFRRDHLALIRAASLPGSRWDRLRGLLRPTPLLHFLRDALGEGMIEESRTPLLVQTTDHETGEGVVLDSGPIAEAVYCSCAVHPFFPPRHFNGRLLFDGAYSAPLPVMAAVLAGARTIIAVEFVEPNIPPSTFLQGAFHVNRLFAHNLTRAQTAFAVDLHYGELLPVSVRFDRRINLQEVGALPEILAAGVAATERFGETILAALAQQDRSQG